MAFLIPVSWLAYKQLGNPLAPLVYGQQLQKITEWERQLVNSPAELEVINEYARRARGFELKLQNVEETLEGERKELREHIRRLNEKRADESVIVAARRELAALPRDVNLARERWTRAMLASRGWLLAASALLGPGNALAGPPSPPPCP